MPHNSTRSKPRSQEAVTSTSPPVQGQNRQAAQYGYRYRLQLNSTIF